MATQNKKFVIKNGLAVGGASGIIDIVDSNGTWVGATGILHGATGPAGSNGATGVGINGASGPSGATGIIQNWTLKTTTYTAVNKDAIAANTSAGSFTITLPASPSAGDSVTIADSGHSFNLNNLTIARNSSTIELAAEDLVVDVKNIFLSLIYDGTTWKVFSTAGIIGASGATGSSGNNGATGPTGATGAGVQGASGASGSAGTQGATGAAGINGASGFVGSNGATGAAGSNGTNGASGVTGATGIIQNWIVKTTTYTAVSKDAIAADTSGGAFTITLPATPASGDSITIADSGHSFNTNNLTIARNGSTIETQSQDLVVDIANVIVSLIYNGTTWKVFSTVGTQGASGSAGATGSAGSNGTNGATGAAGSNGANGATGIQGASGVDGSNGTNGATGVGVQGASGATGIQGASGVDGSNGTNGATGAAGATGAGVQGASGATGIQGPAGQSSSYYNYKAKTTSQSGDPGNGYITWNNATILSANTLQVSHLTNDSFDIDIFLTIVSIGDTLIIQEATDSSRFQKWQVTGTPVVFTNQHYEYPVTLLDSGGTAITNNDNLILAVVSTPVDGATGAQGASGVNGATGAAGTNGASGFVGSNGATGVTGSNGATGSTGPSGATGIIQNWIVKTTTYTSVNKDAIAADTSGGAFTITLPATPSTGDSVTFADSGHTFATNNLTIARNGSTIESSATDFIIDVSNIFTSFIYDGTTWKVFSTIGVQGASGAAGTNGASGSAGTNGATGSAGTNGATGIQGASGSAGSAGTNGATGSAGSNGTNGATGPTGATGIGISGATGTIQNWVVKTTTYTAVNKDAIAADTSGGAFTITLPASPSTGDSVTFADSGHTFNTNNLTVGRNGSTIESSATDLVLDVSNVFVSLIYDGTTWKAFSTVGVQGASGISGASGFVGSNGATGVAGATGSAGSSGTNGATGSAGTNGTDGATGAAGSNGTNGATGAAGSNGTNGATGVAGASGSIGATGAGIDGASGAAGSNGTNGATGVAGATGVGLTGATGPAGGGGGGGASITDDTTTNASYYPAMYSVTTGTPSTVYTSSSKIYFNPSTGTLNSTIYNSLSDKNKKKNVKKIKGALSVVDQLNGVEFQWKDTGVKSYGVIAQELEKVLPDLVTTDDQGNKSVNYNGLFGFLINAIKEQQKQIDDLKGRN